MKHFIPLIPGRQGFPDVMETGPFKTRYELKHRMPKYKTSHSVNYCEADTTFMVHSASVVDFISPKEQNPE